MLIANQAPKTYFIKVKGLSDCAGDKAYETAKLVYENSVDNLSSNQSFHYENLTRSGLVTFLIFFRVEIILKQ